MEQPRRLRPPVKHRPAGLRQRPGVFLVAAAMPVAPPIARSATPSGPGRHRDRLRRVPLLVAVGPIRRVRQVQPGWDLKPWQWGRAPRGALSIGLQYRRIKSECTVGRVMVVGQLPRRPFSQLAQRMVESKLWEYAKVGGSAICRISTPSICRAALFLIMCLLVGAVGRSARCGRRGYDCGEVAYQSAQCHRWRIAQLRV